MVKPVPEGLSIRGLSPVGNRAFPRSGCYLRRFFFGGVRLFAGGGGIFTGSGAGADQDTWTLVNPQERTKETAASMVLNTRTPPRYSANKCGPVCVCTLTAYPPSVSMIVTDTTAP